MSALTGPNAATLIRQAIASELTLVEFEAAWPASASVGLDMINSQQNVLALYEARAARDTSLSELLAEDLSGSADAIEAGRSIDWFDVEPKWSRAANTAVFAIGGACILLGRALSWPWWAAFGPLVIGLGIVWLAEDVWERNDTAGR